MIKNARYYNLIASGGGAKTLNASTIVNNSLTLTSGNINTTSTELLIIDDNATSTAGSSSSFVDGPMMKFGNEAFTFPIGDGTVWARLGISAPTMATTKYTVQYFDASHSDLTLLSPLFNVSAIEYWTLDQQTNDDDVQITLFWEDAVRSDINAFTTDLRVARYNGVDWEDVGHSSITASDPGDVTSPVAPDYSPFTFGSLSKFSNPLPIELVSFNAFYHNQKVIIEWAAAWEQNNDFFTIERSLDAFTFETVVIVDGAGDSQSLLEYSAIDEKPYPGVSYYRLKQTDFDGQFDYSQVVQVINKNTDQDLVLYPNPVSTTSHQVNIRGLVPQQDLQILIKDTTGRLIKNQYLNTDTFGIANLEIGQLKPGIYIISYLNHGKTINQKLVVN